MKIRLPTILLSLILLAHPVSAGSIAPDKQKHIDVVAGMNLAMEAMGVKKNQRATQSSALSLSEKKYTTTTSTMPHMVILVILLPILAVWQ